MSAYDTWLEKPYAEAAEADEPRECPDCAGVLEQEEDGESCTECDYSWYQDLDRRDDW